MATLPPPPPAAVYAAMREALREHGADLAALLPALARAAQISSSGSGDDGGGGAAAAPLRHGAYPALAEAARRFDATRTAGAFATGLLPAIVDAAARYADVFVDSRLVVDAPVTTFTKRQSFSILCNAFLCTFPRKRQCVAAATSDTEPMPLPSLTMYAMHEPSKRHAIDVAHSIEVQKLLMFLDYFEQTAQRVAAASPLLDDPGAALVILRARLPKRCRIDDFEQTVDKPLAPLVMHALGESIDHQHAMLRIDFANRFIGGASLSFGSVQEEITFALCPELNAARLLHTPMDDDEALTLLRGEQFSRLVPGTYGGSLAHGGALPLAEHRFDGAIVAIDALAYSRDRRERRQQYASGAVDRELRKFLAGLAADLAPHGVPAAVAQHIATGNWGCGAFGGDVELKLLVQWLACALHGRTMHYFPFDLAKVERFAPVAARLVERGVTPRMLYTFLRTVPQQQLMQGADRRRRSAAAADDGEGEGECGGVFALLKGHFLAPSAKTPTCRSCC